MTLASTEKTEMVRIDAGHEIPDDNFALLGRPHGSRPDFKVVCLNRRSDVTNEDHLLRFGRDLAAFDIRHVRIVDDLGNRWLTMASTS
ncbi:hypothetical protein GCM10022256_16410 [Frondihabitans peucedani]|uniref:Uncharacterized protein n=1 Tax=Frondihabitans peucedani TaxID=598626 RepID=A0ABP8E1E6_9MICO